MLWPVKPFTKLFVLSLTALGVAAALVLLLSQQASAIPRFLKVPLDVTQSDSPGPAAAAPDLVISVDHAPSLFSPGKLMTYTVTYSNTGSVDAQDVMITTTLHADGAKLFKSWLKTKKNLDF